MAMYVECVKSLDSNNQINHKIRYEFNCKFANIYICGRLKF